MKRHKSLVPLSQDHHLGLVLVQRIRLRKSKAPRSNWPDNRLEQRDRTVQFFDAELAHHFGAEERFLFPLAEIYLSPDSDIVDLLREQHLRLRRYVDQLRELSGSEVEGLLLRFADLLEDHIRKEERMLFEEVQEKIPAEKLDECGRRIEEYFQTCGKPGSHRCVLI